MPSTYPTTKDLLKTTNSVGLSGLMDAIDALQLAHQRATMVQATANPSGGGTVTPDLSLGLTIPIQMPAGNITVANATNAQNGDIFTIFVIQDAIGARTVTWGSAYKKSALTLTVTANAKDCVTFRYDGTSFVQIGSALAVA
jgi:hypothetical protein